jgi:hypothetical protein
MKMGFSNLLSRCLLKSTSYLHLTVSESLPIEEEWLDNESQCYCQSQSDDTITLEAVRTALAKIPGSMSADFIAERNER